MFDKECRMNKKEMLQPGVQSALYPRSLFVYNAYWKEWSRVLQFAQTNVCQVEVDLLPAIPTQKKINIRRHSTARQRSDIYSRYLPMDIFSQMLERYDLVLTNRLLHEDFLSQIDWAKYDAVCNGGAEFDDIMLTPNNVGG